MNRTIILALVLISILGVAIAQEINVSVNVLELPYLSVTFNYNSVNFGSIYQGSTNVKPTPDYTTGVYNVTVSTNSEYYVLARQSGGFPSTLTLYMAVSNNPSQDGTFYDLTTSNKQIYSGNYVGTQYHQYKLNVASDATPGTYNTVVYVTYTL